MTDEEKTELVHRLRNTSPYLDAEAAIRAMDDAADCIESGGASLRALKRDPQSHSSIGTPHVVRRGPNIEALPIIVDCQAAPERVSVPGGPDAKSTITKLLAILDGPRAHNLQKPSQ